MPIPTPTTQVEAAMQYARLFCSPDRPPGVTRDDLMRWLNLYPTPSQGAVLLGTGEGETHPHKAAAVLADEVDRLRTQLRAMISHTGKMRMRLDLITKTGDESRFSDGAVADLLEADRLIKKAKEHIS